MPTALVDWFEGLPSEGPYRPDYMFVGIAPSTKRPSFNRLKPFGASSYKLIQQTREGLKQSGETLYLTNLIKEPLPPRTKVKVSQWRPWVPKLLREIRTIQPKRILTTGVIPAQALIPNFRNLREDHGTFFPVDLGYGTIFIVPTYHFSTFRDNKDLIINDLTRFFTLDPVQSSYTIIQDPDSIFAFLRSLPFRAEVILDIETDGVNIGQAQIKMIGLKYGKKNVVWLPTDPKQIYEFFRIVYQQRIILVGHNLTFDLSMMFFNTQPPPRDWIKEMRVQDTMVLAHIAGEEILSLKHLTSMRTDRMGSHGMGGPESPAYLTEDLVSTDALYSLYPRDSFIAGVASRVIPKLSYMRARGVFIDLERLSIIGEGFQRTISELEADLPPDVNWNSPMQVSKLLLDKGVSLTERTPTGNFSTASKALEAIQAKYPQGSPQEVLVANILAYRYVSKQYTGFVVGYKEEVDLLGYLHPNLKITGTRTGRFSCSNPNLQQVPRQGPMKTIFVPRWVEGSYGLVDLSQAELRVAALLSGDEALLRSLKSTDPHKANASFLYDKPEEEVTAIERKKSKAIMFGVLYGGSARGLASRTAFSEDSIEEAMQLLTQRFPKLNSWIEKTQQEALDTLTVSTIFGRTRSLESVFQYEREGGVKRKAVNTPIQSLASDINLCILLSIIEQIEQQKLFSYPLFMVHDSILLEIYPGEENKISKIVDAAYSSLWTTPLKELPNFKELPIIGELVIGKSWAAVESTNELYSPVLEVKCSSH